LFSGGGHFLSLLVVVVITLLAAALGGLLLIVPGVILYLGLVFAQFYVVDQNMGPIDALKASWEVTKGQRGQLFVFSLAAGLLAIAGYVAWCIGAFATIPLAMVAVATVYTRLSGTAYRSPDNMQRPPGGGYGPGGYGLPGGGYGPPGGGYGPPAGSYSGPPGYGPPPGGGFDGPPR
jgi:uncharacterized membrane protein